MEQFFEYAPNIHPMIVHFPIALFVVAIGLNLLTFFLPEKWWDEKKTTFIYLLGAISAIIAYFTGRSAADTVFLPTPAQSYLTDHADWALWTVLFFCIYALIRVAIHKFELFEKKPVQMLIFALALPGLFLLFETGEYGATMVYGYGVGTGQLLAEETEESIPLQAESDDITSLFITKENGDWNWKMSPSSVTDLQEQFHWVIGNADQLNSSVAETDTETYLSFNPKDHVDNLFVTHSTYKNVQVDAYLDISAFEGEVQIIHHLQNDKNYDFVKVTSKGKIVQGRLEDGTEKVFDEKEYENDGLKFIRVVGDGTHFRGYINKEMLVHGHGDDPKSGNIGLKINGHGFVLLKEFSLAQL